MRDWSQLNRDLLGEIALKFDAIEDFVYFSIVCRSWNRASSMVKYIWKPPMPYFVLADYHKVYNLNSDKCNRLNLTDTPVNRCWGSGCGWIATGLLGGPTYVNNPFTKARIRLPAHPIHWYEDAPIDFEDELAGDYQQISIRKVIVVQNVESGDNNNGNGLIVFAMHTDWRKLLAFSRPGDLQWSSVIPPWPLTCRAADIVCRDRLVLILYEDASVGYVDLSDLSKRTKLEQFVQAKEFFPSPGAFKKRLSMMHLLEMYLVESFGNLLMVLRHKSTYRVPNGEVSEDEIYKTVRFEVFGINLETKKWDPVTDLGDVALFVGDNQSISVRASNCRNCKPNCIYFTDDCDYLWDLPQNLGGHDMGFYNLNDGKINQFYKSDDVHSGFCTPFWFMPQF